jgi:hypothetical protein
MSYPDSNKCVDAFQFGEQGGDLPFGQHGGQPWGTVGPLNIVQPRKVRRQNLLVQKEQRA